MRAVIGWEDCPGRASSQDEKNPTSLGKFGFPGVLKTLPPGGLLLLVSRTGLAGIFLQPPEKQGAG